MKQVFRVGPYDYTAEHEDVEYFRDDGLNLIGKIDHQQLTMRIAAKNNPAVIFVSEWHECLHALDNYMEIGLKEKQIGRLAHGIVGLLKDNPCLRECPELDKEESNEVL